MLHVDIRTDDKTIIVEVSNDGAPWHLLATFPVYPETSDMNHTKQRVYAEHWARAWGAGARYAGAEVRFTSHGYGM